MTLAHRDFFPRVVEPGFFPSQHELLSAVVERANRWIASSSVRVINVETVLLPNVGGEDDSSRSAIRTSGEWSSRWYQVIRVWYDASSGETGGPSP